MPGDAVSEGIVTKMEHGEMPMKMSSQSAKLDGPVLIGEETRTWALAGLLIGAVLGAALGLALGYGVISVRIMAPIGASSVAVPSFVVASILAAAGALTGALLGTRSEATATKAGTQQTRDTDESHMPMPSGGWLAHLPIDGSIALITIMALTLYAIVSTAIATGAPSDQSNRVHWELKNATRVGGIDDRATELAAIETAYPGTRPENRASMAYVVPNDWRMALAATPLIARPTNVALVVNDSSGAAGRVVATGAIDQCRPRPSSL